MYEKARNALTTDDFSYIIYAPASQWTAAGYVTQKSYNTGWAIAESETGGVARKRVRFAHPRRLRSVSTYDFAGLGLPTNGGD